MWAGGSGSKEKEWPVPLPAVSWLLMFMRKNPDKKMFTRVHLALKDSVWSGFLGDITQVISGSIKEFWNRVFP